MLRAKSDSMTVLSILSYPTKGSRRVFEKGPLVDQGD